MKTFCLHRIAAFAAVLFFIMPSAYAQQSPLIQWAKCYGGTNNDQSATFQQTADSGFIIGGFSNSIDGNVTGNHGGNDLWVIKIDQFGALQWEKSLGGTGAEIGSTVIQTKDMGYMVAGHSNSTNGDVTGNHGKFDYWVVKLDPTGALQWEKSFGGSDTEQVSLIRPARDGGYIVSGRSNSVDGDVTGNHGGYDIWVVKMDSLGNLQWERSYGGSGDETGGTINPTSDGGFIMQGSSNSTDGDVTGNHGGYDFWVVKIDSVGNIQWERSFGGSGDDEGRSVQQTPDGGYVVAAYSNSTDGDITGNHGGYDYWVARLDSAGNIKWERSYGGSGDDEARNVVFTKDGGYIISGISNSTDGEVTGNHGSYDYWIVKIDSVGNIQWQRSLGGSGDDEVHVVRQIIGKDYLTIGTTSSTDGDVIGNHGKNDFWVVKLHFYPVISSTQSLTIPALPCGGQVMDTVYVHNTGTDLLVIDSSAFGSNGAAFSVISPATFPDSVTGGDSIRFIIAFSPQIVGTMATTLSLFSNDTAHNPWQINVSGNAINLPTIQLLVKPDTGSVNIPSDGKIYVIGNFLTSLFVGDTITFGLMNDIATLQFDSAFSQWGNVVAETVTDTEVSISIKITQLVPTDTFAMLYYKTLIGSTLSPMVNIFQDCATSSMCYVVQGNGGAAIQLRPPGCELGTLRFNSFNSALQAVYPNPTAGVVSVAYSTVERADVNIEVMDAFGRTVQTVVNAPCAPGVYSASFDIHSLTGGVYFVRMREGEYVSTKELFLLR
jgi:hypothetical protein